MLFGTFLIVRIGSCLFHDKEGYRTKNEKSKTPTYLVRKITGLDFHHSHIGMLVLLVSLTFILLRGFSNVSVMLLAIGLSLIADQIVPLLNRKRCCYSLEMWIVAILLHIAIVLVAISLF